MQNFSFHIIFSFFVKFATLLMRHLVCLQAYDHIIQYFNVYDCMVFIDCNGLFEML